LPVTPFHYPLAYVLSKVDKRLSLPGVVVGAMVSDLEIPLIILFFPDQFPNNRLVLHSLLGGATVGAILAMMLTIYLYSHVVSAVFKIQKDLIKVKTHFSVPLAISCIIGTSSHVLLDILTHQENPVFWPVQTTISSPICPYQASLPVHAVLAASLLILLIINRKNVLNEILVG